MFEKSKISFQCFGYQWLRQRNIINDEVLNQLAAEDILQEEFGQLSLNAISSSDHTNCIKFKTKVQDKVMLILLDSGSSHSFISSTFVQMAKLSTESPSLVLDNWWNLD